MAIDIDHSLATKLLNASYSTCLKNPVASCPIQETIDFVLSGRNCLTYRYIMVTALLAKAVDSSVDMLSLQVKDKSKGSFDARALARNVVFPFQKTILGNALDGSNSDPLVNKPGRFERLSKDNPVAAGDPAKALLLLCENLPKVRTKAAARVCVDYIVSKLLSEQALREAKKQSFAESSRNANFFVASRLIGDLLDQGFGGSALVVATTALFSLIFDSDEYEIVPHPVTQIATKPHE